MGLQITENILLVATTDNTSITIGWEPNNNSYKGKKIFKSIKCKCLRRGDGFTGNPNLI